ncbi:MAG: imidazoleglycerol-phosphate dehydratase [Gemmatimonadaceae bacterium]|jgi:imidazoleglycerol-phosphate dehydratase|nr:imidazoleglycerol-phosphate dehydratase [Gemmatimonadaceae bacterium]
MTTVVRETKETRVHVSIGIGRGTADVKTGEPFLDHMLTAFARYGGLDLSVQATGDLKHHLIEDVGITVGAAVHAITPVTCARFGERLIPMDDALVQVALDLGGRFWYEGKLPSALYEHFLRSFAEHAKATLHVRVLRGRDRHHIVEAAFKAVGLALRQALADDPSGAVFSTKGSVELDVVRGGRRGDGVPAGELH